VAGYSGTPLPKKLGIINRGAVALIGAPDGFARLIGVEPARLAKGAIDVVILFASQQKTLKAALGKAAAALKEDGNLWVAWPKKSSGVATDVTEICCARSSCPPGSSTTRCAPSTTPGRGCASASGSKIANSQGQG